MIVLVWIVGIKGFNNILITIGVIVDGVVVSKGWWQVPQLSLGALLTDLAAVVKIVWLDLPFIGVDLNMVWWSIMKGRAMRTVLDGTGVRSGARLLATNVVTILILMALSPFEACAMDGAVIIVS